MYLTPYPPAHPHPHALACALAPSYKQATSRNIVIIVIVLVCVVVAIVQQWQLQQWQQQGGSQSQELVVVSTASYQYYQYQQYVGSRMQQKQQCSYYFTIYNMIVRSQTPRQWQLRLRLVPSTSGTSSQLSSQQYQLASQEEQYSRGKTKQIPIK